MCFQCQDSRAARKKRALGAAIDRLAFGATNPASGSASVSASGSVSRSAATASSASAPASGQVPAAVPPKSASRLALAVPVGVQSSRLALPGRTFLISLGSAVGQQRRCRAAGEFVFEARPGQLAATFPPDVSKRFATRPCFAQNKRDAWPGAYCAHSLVWRENAKLDHGCFVL